MATRTPTIAVPVDQMARVVSWAGLLNGDVGAGHIVADAADILALILSGTLGAGGTVTWQGSLDNVNWFALSSKIGTPAAVAQTALLTPAMIQERPIYIRPNVTAGDGTTTLVAQINAQRYF